MKRQIFAMGGGGFLMEPDNLLLDQFIVSLAEKKRPKICFVATASGDSQSVYDRFYQAMEQHEVDSTHLSLFQPPLGSLRDFVLQQDIIYVGGGNTRNLIVLWKEWGLDVILREAYERGIVLAGISAGSICWFEEGVTDSITGSLTQLNCLGFLPGSNCPHYNGEVERRPAYQKLVAAGMKAGIACDDGVAAHYVDDKLTEFVSSRRNAMAYRLEIKSGKVSEVPIKPRFLG